MRRVMLLWLLALVLPTAALADNIPIPFSFTSGTTSSVLFETTNGIPFRLEA